MSDNQISKQNTKLGFIGLGLMGSRFFRRLHAEGWTIRGWNRTQSATLLLKRDGLIIAESLADMVHGSQLLLSSLGNDDAVRAVYLGENGVFANAQPETIVLEMSTISPDVSALLHEESKKRRMHLIDLPVSDRPRPLRRARSRCSEEASRRYSTVVFLSLSRSQSSGT